MPISSMPAAERLAWTAAAWEDYLYWQGQDRRQLKRINQLIHGCLRDAFGGDRQAGTFSQTFSHPSLRRHETLCGAGGSANQKRSFPS